MKHIILILSSLLFLISGLIVGCSQNATPNSNKGNANVENLNTAAFKDKVYDFTAGNDWKYKGAEPCIIDFYATWCGPCKRLSPTIDNLSELYKGKIKFYQVDVDQEKDLASAFGVESIPTIYLCPVGGKPVIEYGALSKEKLVALIDSTFKKL